MRETREELSLQPRLTRTHRPPRPKLPRRAGGAGRSRTRPESRGRGVFLLDGRRLRRSTIKVSYSKNSRGASWAAHGTYLGRQGAQREGAKGRGFDALHEDVDLTSTLRGWQQADDSRLWKFIVSPEDGARLDLHAHTRALVEKMEHDLGTALEWVAIDHHNTDNPHVHLLVRGRDVAGRPLEIAPAYLKSGLRARSEEVATGVLGWRTEREHLAARGRMVEQSRFTEIDRALLRRVSQQGLVSYQGPRPRTRYGHETRLHEMRRLQFLTRLGFAQKVGSRTWQLAPSFEPALRQAQLSGDVIKSRAAQTIGRGGRQLMETRNPSQPAKTGPTGRPTERSRPLPGARPLPSLKEVERNVGRPVPIMLPTDGLIYRGQLVAYARGQDNQRYAVVNIGREVVAFRTEDAGVISGRDVRATGHQVEEDRRRRLIWRLGDDEREQHRERSL